MIEIIIGCLLGIAALIALEIIVIRVATKNWKKYAVEVKRSVIGFIGLMIIPLAALITILLTRL